MWTGLNVVLGYRYERISRAQEKTVLWAVAWCWAGKGGGVFTFALA